MMRRAVAIVPSAGRGTRFGSNKTMTSLKGRPLIAWTLQALHFVDEIEEVVPVFAPELMEAALRLMEVFDFNKVKRIVPGGEERQNSVMNGLRAVESDPDLVLIHDGVRPLVRPSLVRLSLSSIDDFDGLVVGVPPKDTIKTFDGDVIGNTLRREGLIAVQTPQVFRYKTVCKAYEQALSSGRYFTDDASVVEVFGGSIKLIPGDYSNIKITTPEDLLIAEAIFKPEIQKES